MKKLNTKTITLTGSEQEIRIAGQNCDIRNDGTEIIYAASEPSIVAGADGVLSVPVGQSAKLLGTDGTVYLLGTGSVQLCGNDYAELVFKSAATSLGGGGTVDDVARTTISSHVANNSIHLNEEKAIEAAATTISNPNLLINSWFGKGVINQRGLTEYVGGNKYTVDRWYTSDRASANITLSVLSSGITISIDTSLEEASNKNWMMQMFEEMTFKTDTAVTLSVCAKGDFGMAYYGGDMQNYHSDDFTIKSFTYIIPAGTWFGDKKKYCPLVGLSQTGDYAEFIWAKLECGSVATPFVPPHPAEELAKCQRYYQVIDVTKRPSTNTSKSFGRYGGAITGGSTSLMITVPIAPMRIPPTLSITGSIDVRSISGYVADGLSLDGCTVTTDYLPYAHSIDLMISKTDGSQWGTLGDTPEVLKNNTPINLEFKSNTILSFDAEL